MSAMCSCGGGAKSPSAGRKRSVALLLFAIVISLTLQYFIAPNAYSTHLEYAWHCDEVAEQYQENCRGNSAVLRVSFCTTVFFLFAAIAAAGAPSSNKSFWFIKLVVYLAMVGGSMFLPSEVFDEHGYLQVARVGGAIFVVLQQIILIDLAYNWNDAWVANADADERDEPGSGAAWLKALLFVSAFIMVLSYTALGFLIHFFGGCSSNSSFLWVTLVLTLGSTVVQLTGDEGSLLTSAVMTGYAVFLAYSAVSNNPDETCNPMLGQDNWLDITLGIVFILASMTWTCFSYASSMTEMFQGDTNQMSLIEEGQGGESTPTPVKGVVTGDGKYGATSEGDANNGSGGEAFTSVRESVGGDFDNGQAWKLNIVLCLLSMWYPMVLTSWGSINEGGTSANKSVGEVAMWMIIAAQWVAMALYIWTIVAPRLFPDRDFS
eukprot:CAMPEP_0182459936 /NCGR_PEP_ID=MMETSP1319-20130603/4924_1 /TAXON_ID=172717 /ORGANISM="Bolidomonas pacifica, Strain RCC208" /LENGTH=433 /DNA_ID=CAMNT_0024658955 /DNA_START=389 /DNA_END=1690 /DNA_ORIENTATION=+